MCLKPYVHILSPKLIILIKSMKNSLKLNNSCFIWSQIKHDLRLEGPGSEEVRLMARTIFKDLR